MKKRGKKLGKNEQHQCAKEQPQYPNICVTGVPSGARDQKNI